MSLLIPPLLSHTSEPSVSQRLTRLQHVRDPFLRLAHTDQLQKRFALQVQKILLGNSRSVIQVSTSQNPRQLRANLGIVIGNISRAFHLMNAEFQSCESGFAQRQNVCSLLRSDVATRRERQHLFLRVGNQPILVHRNRIVRRQKTQTSCFFSRGRNFRQRDRLKSALHKRKRIRIARVLWNQVERAQQQLLSATARGNNPDANLDQSDIRFRRGSHAVRVQHHLTTATEDHLKRRDDDRLRRVTQTHRRLLENSRHHVELVPVLFLCFHQHQHDVGADAEVWSLVSDDETDEVFVNFGERKLQHLERVAADGVHLRVKLETRNTITDVEQRRAGVFLDYTRAIFD